MIRLHGLIRSPVPTDLSTYVAVLSGTRTPDPSDDNPSPVPIRFSVNAEVKRDGKFQIELPSGWINPLELDVYDPAGLGVAHHILDPEEEQRAKVEIEIEPSVPLEIPPGDTSSKQRSRLHGRVIEASGKTQVSGAQVILWAFDEPSGEHPVLVANTDSQGYFFGDIPVGTYDRAYGIVSASPTENVPVALSEGSFPNTVILVIHSPAGDVKKEDCGCSDISTAVPRIPDSEVLTSASGTYSTDIGTGGCVDFTVPNRALEEFSYYSIVRTTQPRLSIVRTPVPPGGTVPGVKLGGFTSLNIDGIDVATDYERLGQNPRRELGQNNPIPWWEDAKALTYQASTVAHGHILHFKQEWVADGYSLGDLIHSLPLGPCEKKQIAIVDWQRQERAQREETEVATDTLAASIERGRDVTDIVNAALSESMRGGSTASNWGVAGGLGAAASYMGLGAVIGVSGGAGGADASAWQDASRTLGASSLQWLRDRTMQAASDMRSARRNVVVTVSQRETTQVETSVVHNHNHCHAITIEYFEVLRHLQVRHYLSEVRECLLVPLLMSEFDASKIFRWREQLENTLREAQLAAAFPAVERQVLKYIGLDIPDARYADDPVEHMSGHLTLQFTLVRPADKADGSFDDGAWIFLSTLFKNAGLPVPAAATPLELFNRILQAPLGLFTNPLSILDDIGSIFGGSPPSPPPPPPEEKDRVFQEKYAPLIASAYCRALAFKIRKAAGEEVIFNLIPTLIEKYAEGVALRVSLNLGSKFDPILTRADIDGIIVSGGSDILPASSRVILHDIHLDYRTIHIRHVLLDDTLDQDLIGVGALVDAPLDEQEKRNPRQEDSILVTRLIGHLNDHVEFYHRAIWMGMDQERRYMLLDSVASPAPNLEGRSIASVVENRLLGIIGNTLVLPVAPGFKLDPTYASKSQADLIRVYSGREQVPPMRISVPTSGVYAEAVMGVCNACEKKDDSRFWRFEESPCGDEPMPIVPPSTASRRTDPGDLTTKNLAAPIIAMQNAPAAPDPAGIASALQVLGTSNLFRDVTGLSDTQKAALASFQSSLQAAQKFASEAAGLSKASLGQQAQTTANSDRIFQSIDSAQQSGQLSRDQAAGLKQQTLKQMIGSTGQPLPTDLSAIEQAKDKGLITSDQASSLTSSALSRLMGGEVSDVTQNQLGLPKLVDSAAQASDSSVSYSRTGDSESMSINKSGTPAWIGMGGLLNYQFPGPFAKTTMTYSTLGLTRDDTLLAQLIPIARPFPESGFAIIDLSTNKMASVKGGELILAFSVVKLGIAVAAFRLKQAVEEFANVSSATNIPQLISEITGIWKPIVTKAFPYRNPDFPNIERILTFTVPTTSEGWKVGFTTTPALLPFKDNEAHGGGVFCRKELGFKERMQLMLEWSNNEAANTCLDDLGFQYIQGVLETEGFEVDRGLGIWVGNHFPVPDFVRKRTDPWGTVNPTKDKPKGNHVATPDGLAMLMTALANNKLIEQTDPIMHPTNPSIEIKRMMQNSVPLPNNQSFMLDAFRDAGITSKVEYCKDGAGPDPPGLVSEVDRCTKLPSGKKYAAVLLRLLLADFYKAAVAIENSF